MAETLKTDATLILNGEQYIVADHQWEPVASQPGDAIQSWERTIENGAFGWGSSRFTRPGSYDYASAASLHRAGAFLPGAAITTPSFGATTPLGNVSFCEYWDTDGSNRRLICVGSRTIHEINSSGTITGTSLTGTIGSTLRMGKGFRFKAPTAMATPHMYFPVQYSGATDYFIRRTAANTYAETGANKRAQAMCAGKDIDGEDVVWRIDENGRLNATTADSDPNSAGSWAGATYATGEGSSKVNDIIQVGRTVLVGREDGAWAWDTAKNSIPITRGLEQTPDANNFTFFKEANGYVVAPTAAGIIWIEGLDWGMCGPVSANPDARNLRGEETAVSGAAGTAIYAAVYLGGTSYIFYGMPRRQGDTGEGPFSWHGPIASIAQRVEDLHVSTVWGRKLWMGYSGGFAYLSLNEDFSPVTDATSGTIYLPEGIFDMDGAHVIKDFERAEFIAPARAPFDSDNAWTIEVETTPGSGTYVAIDGGVVNSGVTAERFWTTETSGTRLRARLAYSSNAGAAELEAVVVRGKMRPKYTRVHTFVLNLSEETRTPRLARLWRSGKTQRTALEALAVAGRTTVTLNGQESLTGHVVSVKERTQREGHLKAPGRQVELVFREAVLA